MSRLKLLLFVAFVSFLVTGGSLYLFGQSREREVARLREENNQLRFQASQRRNSPGTSNGQTQAFEAAASDNADQAGSPAATIRGGVADEDYRDEGNATPIAALQTFAWAGDQGGAEVLQRMITFDPLARTKAAGFLSRLPPDIRETITSPEQLLAIEMTANMIQHPFPRSDWLTRAATESITDNRVVLRLPGSGRDGMEFQRVDGGWRFVITEAMVDDFLSQHGR